MIFDSDLIVLITSIVFLSSPSKVPKMDDMFLFISSEANIYIVLSICKVEQNIMGVLGTPWTNCLSEKCILSIILDCY
jgi:hypothetical protein